MKKSKNMKGKAGGTPVRKAMQSDSSEREYECIAGIHIEGTGEGKVQYEKGDTITTERPMDKLFKNKWRKVGGGSRRPRDLDETLDQSGRVMDRNLATVGDEDEDEAPKRVKGGKKPMRVRGEQTSPSDNDFDEEDGEENETQTEDTEGEEDSEEESEEGDEEEETVDSTRGKGKFGRDVTETFQTASDANLKVFSKGKKGGFTVVDADEPDTPLEGGRRLKTKGQVNKFVAGYAKK